MKRVEATFVSSSVAGTERLGEELGKRLRAGCGVALVGDLGAGKTAFTRGVARGLGLEDPGAVASPTYLVAIEHDGPIPMLHVDAYLGTKAESFLLDGGLDYLHELGAVLVLEWADRIPGFWPDETVEVRIGPVPDEDLPAGATEDLRRRIVLVGPEELVGQDSGSPFPESLGEGLSEVIRTT